MARATAGRPELNFEADHFRGMRYISDLKDWDPRYVYRALNLLPHNGVYWPRPGDAPWAVDAFVARTVQGEELFRKADGTVLDVIVAGGEIYKRPGAGTTFTKEITAAQLGAAAITLSAATRVWMATFNDKLILSDGINTPFAWDGTSGGGLTKLTNAPVAYGPPFVYYGKLGFVKNVERNVWVWSEENQPNTGYEAGGFNNAWRLSQTAQAGPLERMIGLNDGLYYFRKNSIGVIRGAITPDFATSGVQDAVAGNVGTTAPGSVLYCDGYIWFTDQFGRPMRLAPGGKAEEIWKQLDAYFAGSDNPGTGAAGRMVASDIALTLCQPYPHVNGVVFAYTPYNDPYYSKMFVFRSSDAQLLGEIDFSQNIDYVGPGVAEGLEDIPTLSVSYRSGIQTLNYTTPVSQAGTNFYASNASSRALVLGPLSADRKVLPHWDLLEIFVEHIVDVAACTLSATCNSGSDLDYAASVVLNNLSIAGLGTKHKRRRVTVGLSREQRFLMTQLSIGSGILGFAAMRAHAFGLPLPPAVS